MIWFIVMVASIHGRDIPTDAISGFRFRTHTACMQSAKVRADALRSVGARGKYMCMYPGEPYAVMRAIGAVRL